jgi:tetratricopeptide (TPR) repeat protein
MAHLFRGRGADGTGRLEKDLAELESQAKGASPGYETQFLNRAGNLCVEAGQPARALGYFGRAIDAYLESGRFSAAEVLCRKVLQIAPEAVRARSTLAWLALGKGFDASTRSEIAEYVHAAERAAQQELAGKQLLLMAEATGDVDLRQEIAKHLLELDEAEKADIVFGMVFEERNGLRPAPITDEGKLWAKLLRAALMGPKELEQQGWGGTEEESDALPSLPKKSAPEENPA